jgi:DNA-binding NarL/FixJ family response regulator
VTGGPTAGPLRIFVADDVPDMRALVRFALAQAPDMIVVGEAATGVATVRGISDLRPDVLLLDLSMPDLNGLEVIPYVVEHAPDTGIVVFSGFEAARMRGPATALGAHRYVEKGRPLEELRAAIREVGGAKRTGGLGRGRGGAGAPSSLSAMWDSRRTVRDGLRRVPRLGRAQA